MKIGIIGGSGLYQVEHLEKVKEVTMETPFGMPSDQLVCGELNGIEMVFLPRHGRNHTILPSELNHRANIFAMKKLGVTHLVSLSAVGSLKEELRPRDIVVVDQYVDRTKQDLAHTFFGNGIVAHVSMANPVCPELAATAVKAVRQAIAAAALGAQAPTVHEKGTYLNMEGPAFSSKAESLLYRSWGMDVIGMTNFGEAKLAREAEIAYSTIAMVTDYDCWHPDHDHVTVDMIVENLHANSALAKAIIAQLAALAGELPPVCSCHSALATALVTPAKAIPPSLRRQMQPIIGKYIK